MLHLGTVQISVGHLCGELFRDNTKCRLSTKSPTSQKSKNLDINQTVVEKSMSESNCGFVELFQSYLLRKYF